MVTEKLWKVASIILFVILILETSFIVLVFYWGYQEIEIEEKNIILENKCAINVCADYDAYWYDTETHLCDCYKDGEIVYEEVIE